MRRSGDLSLSPIPVASIAAFMAVLLAGCALAPRRPMPWPLPGVEDAPIAGRWVQTLVLEREGRSLELLAVIEREGAALTVAGLSPMGQRLVRIVWSAGKVEQENDPNLPVKIDGEAILRDIVFANWPPDKLREVFRNTGWTASFAGARRTLAWKGRPWLEVREEPAAAPGNTAASAGNAVDGPVVVVDHPAEGYRVRVTTVERDAP